MMKAGRPSSSSRTGLQLAALGFAIGLGGCASPALKPGGVVPVGLSLAEKDKDAAVPLTHVLALTLPPAPAAHSWQIAYHDPRFLQQQTGFVPAGRAGEGPTISFLAVGLGTTRLHFLLLPDASSGGVDPVDRHEVRVRIQ